MTLSEEPGRLIMESASTATAVGAIVLALVGIALGCLGMASHDLWLFWLALVLVILGALMACRTTTTHIVLAKYGVSRVSHRRLLSESTSECFALADASTVQLYSSTVPRREHPADDRAPRNTRVSSTLLLMLRNGKPITLGSLTRIMKLRDSTESKIESMPLKNEAERVAGFVGIPLLAQDATDFGSSPG